MLRPTHIHAHTGALVANTWRDIITAGLDGNRKKWEGGPGRLGPQLTLELLVEK